MQVLGTLEPWYGQISLAKGKLSKIDVLMLSFPKAMRATFN